MLRRDVELVKLLSARLLEVSTDYETFLGGPEGHLFHSWALLHERDDAALWERLQRSLDQLDETRTWALLPFMMAAAAELSAARGDHAAARRLLMRAKELGGLTGERWCQPEIIRLEAAFLSDDPADKADMLHRAIELSREQGSNLWRLRSAIDLAELLRDQGQPRQGARTAGADPRLVQRRIRRARPAPREPSARNFRLTASCTGGSSGESQMRGKSAKSLHQVAVQFRTHLASRRNMRGTRGRSAMDECDLRRLIAEVRRGCWPVPASRSWLSGSSTSRGGKAAATC